MQNLRTVAKSADSADSGTHAPNLRTRAKSADTRADSGTHAPNLAWVTSAAPDRLRYTWKARGVDAVTDTVAVPVVDTSFSSFTRLKHKSGEARDERARASWPSPPP